MNIEAEINKLKIQYSDPKEAFRKLDSIAYFGDQLGLEAMVIRTQLTVLTNVAISYGDSDIDILRIIDERYAEACEEPQSRLQGFLLGKNGDPMNKFRDRVQTYREQYHQDLALKGVDNMAEDVFIGLKSPDARKAEARRSGRTKTG